MKRGTSSAAVSGEANGSGTIFSSTIRLAKCLIYRFGIKLPNFNCQHLMFRLCSSPSFVHCVPLQIKHQYLWIRKATCWCFPVKHECVGVIWNVWAATCYQLIKFRSEITSMLRSDVPVIQMGMVGGHFNNSYLGKHLLVEQHVKLKICVNWIGNIYHFKYQTKEATVGRPSKKQPMNQ